MSSISPEPSSTLHLNPGELFIGEEPIIVSTILGSCVGLTLFHPQRKVAMLCHAILPIYRPSRNHQSDKHQGLKNSPFNQPVKKNPEIYRYVDSVFEFMFKACKERKIPLKEMQAKLFGGSNLFHHENPYHEGRSVGQQNISTAMAILETTGIRLTAQDVGTSRGRKIFFNTETGEVLVKRMNMKSMQQLDRLCCETKERFKDMKLNGL
ncbi:chemotaxis protein CheD [Magnetococcales bacterium HHB-1]